MVNLVFLPDATQYTDGLGDRRFVDDDLRKTPFECSIGLDVLPVLCQSCGTDAAQLSCEMIMLISRLFVCGVRSLPRAKRGLKRLAASMPPPSLPRPAMMRCNSSMNRITPTPSSDDFSTSSRTALMRSSYSPLYLAPAMSAPISREKSFYNEKKIYLCTLEENVEPRTPIRLAGTSRLMIRCASPSAIEVFPTPGSPMRTGLFFVLLYARH